LRTTTMTLLCGLAALLMGSQAGSNSAAELRYVVRPFDGGYDRTHVILAFRGGQSGVCKVLLPHGWFGGDSAGKRVENVHALSPGTSLESAAEGSFETVRFPPGSEVRIGYNVFQGEPRPEPPPGIQLGRGH